MYVKRAMIASIRAMTTAPPSKNQSTALPALVAVGVVGAAAVGGFKMSAEIAKEESVAKCKDGEGEVCGYLWDLRQLPTP
mmetsp:Transcript_36601/g.73395  ORF Transcript_36601/g.73395 Transcript_36601/m.73395 type:complete len:80 (-) Transcript_36601:129-368(-)